MAGSMMSFTAIGNLGRAPEVRHIQDGSKIVTLNLAVSESWKDRNSGEQKEKTEWLRVVIFNPRLSELAEKYLIKGSKICIHNASLQTRKWTDQSGAERYTTEVVIGRFKGELTLLDGTRQEDGAPNAGPSAAGGGRSVPDDLDDEIPF